MDERSIRLIMVAIGTAVGLFLAWQASGTLLLIFAGVLLGVLLDALTRATEGIVPLGRSWRLACICIVLGLAFAGAIAWGGYTLVQEWDELAPILNEQLQNLRGRIEQLTGQEGDVGTLTQQLLPDPARLLGGAGTAFTAALGMAGSTILVVLIGIFLAASPATYRRGFLQLVPPDRRTRVGEVVDEMAETLRWWLIGQLIAMTVIGITVGIMLTLVGVPGATLLGLQAGLLNFIPYLGSLVAAVPVLLASTAQGLSVFLWVLGLYLVIQTLEGYVLNPLVQKRVVHLPPVLTLASLMIFGVLFGAIGVAMATPIVAAFRIAVLRLYVEDVLHETGRHAD